MLLGCGQRTREEEASGLLTWGAGDVVSGREVGMMTGGRGGGGGREESGDMSQLERISRFGQGQTTGTKQAINAPSLYGQQMPSWHSWLQRVIDLCSLGFKPWFCHFFFLLYLLIKGLHSIKYNHINYCLI